MSLRKSAYLLIGSSGVAQLGNAALIVAIPVLYTPADAGRAQAFMSLLALIATVCTGRVDQIVLIEPDNEIPDLLRSGIAITALLALLSVLGMTALYLLSAESGRMASIYWLLGPCILATGLVQLAQALAIRRKNYAALARTRIEQTFLGGGLAFGFGVLGLGAFGLVIAQTVQLYGRGIRLLRRTDPELSFRDTLARTAPILAPIRKNWKLLLAGSGSALANSAAWAVPIFIIANEYGAAEAGFLALGLRVVGPIRQIVLTTATQLSLGRGAELVAAGNRDGLRHLMLAQSRISCLVACLAVVVAVIANLLADALLPLPWRPSANYFIPAGLVIAMQIAINPLTSVGVLMKAQAIHFWYDLARVLLVGAMMYGSVFWGLGGPATFYSFTIAMGVMYLMYYRLYIWLLQ